MSIMDKPNPHVYPRTYQFAETLNDQIDKVDPPADMMSLTIQELAETLVEIVKEYEHGTAEVYDVGDNGDITLDDYTNVATDIFIYLRGKFSGNRH